MNGFDQLSLLVGRIVLGLGFIYGGALLVIHFLSWWWGLVEGWWPQPYSLKWLLGGALIIFLLWIFVAFVGGVLLATYRFVTEGRK